jgi:hypothetical protein
LTTIYRHAHRHPNAICEPEHRPESQTRYTTAQLTHSPAYTPKRIGNPLSMRFALWKEGCLALGSVRRGRDEHAQVPQGSGFGAIQILNIYFFITIYLIKNMKLKGFKKTQKGYVFTFENESQMPIVIQTVMLTKKLAEYLTVIESCMDALFFGNNTTFIGYTLKDKPSEVNCVYEIATIINGIRVFGKTQELFFGDYDESELELLKLDDRLKAEKFIQISDTIKNKFEIQAISDIQELMTANEQMSLFN